MKKRSLTVTTALMLVLLTVVTTFNITFFLAAEYYNARLGDLQDVEGRYDKLNAVAKTVEKYFVGDYEESAALEAAAAGYVDGLGDRWSAYYTAEETEALLAAESNSYVGVGLTYSTQEADAYTVLSVTPESPAALAGMQVGDVLRAVDGVPVTELGTPSELVTSVKGEEGTSVTLTVMRAGEELSFTMERANVYNESVQAELLEGGVGYLRIDGFETNVDVEFRNKLQDLIDRGAQGLIFDVRWNPGGFLNVMRSMLDLLLPEGTVISTVDKQGNTKEYTSDAACLTLPMAVIVNENSISAAEFFAAALQEYGVAEVVGAHTGGKGFSQQLIRLDDGSSVNLSTTRYYTPKGMNLADVGVTPDAEVAMDADYATFFYLAHEDDVQLQKALEIVTAAVGAAAPADGTEAATTPAAATPAP